MFKSVQTPKSCDHVDRSDSNFAFYSFLSPTTITHWPCPRFSMTTKVRLNPVLILQLTTMTPTTHHPWRVALMTRVTTNQQEQQSTVDHHHTGPNGASTRREISEYRRHLTRCLCSWYVFFFLCVYFLYTNQWFIFYLGSIYVVKHEEGLSGMYIWLLVCVSLFIFIFWFRKSMYEQL